MISIVVSSINHDHYSNFERNVALTIGYTYEMIRIYNPGIMGICEAYNKGAQQSKSGILLFVHEDVEFITQNWGQLLVQAFSELNNAGVIGIAGGVYKSKMVSGWSQEILLDTPLRRTNLVQVSGRNPLEEWKDHQNPFDEKYSQVVSLDGVFLSVKKELWQLHPFDETGLKGFHGYDMDFSLTLLSSYRNYVCYNILLRHFSKGNLTVDWLKAIIKVHRKHFTKLPVQTIEASPEFKKTIEKVKLFSLLDLIKTFNIPLLKKIRLVLGIFSMYKLHWPDLRVIYRVIRLSRGNLKSPAPDVLKTTARE